MISYGFGALCFFFKNGRRMADPGHRPDQRQLGQRGVFYTAPGVVEIAEKLVYNSNNYGLWYL